MKAMILAGGLSTRLYPLTKQVPKPLVPVAGEPNAVHLLRYLRAAGFDEIAINVFYLPDAIRKALGDGSAFDVKLTYLHEEVLLGSAGAVKQMETFFAGDTFVVVGCDDLTDLSLADLVAFHKERKALATIALVEREHVDQYGVVVTDESGKIIGFQEKPAPGTEKSHKVNTGVYVFEPAIFDEIPEGEFYDFGKQVFPGLQAVGAAFYGFDAKGAYWCDIGTLDEYRRATRDVLAGALVLLGARATGVDATAKIGEGVIITGDVRIGKNAVIEANATIIGPTVIGNGAHISANASVSACILWNGASIGAGAQLTNVIVGKNTPIPPHARLENTAVANE